MAPNVTGFFHDLSIPQWNLHLRVMIYRKHVGHESPKNFQLDLFTPDDGHFEFGAVATNLPLDLAALYAFICGRGAQVKTIAKLQGEFAPHVIPMRHYGANKAWQQLSNLAHNLIRSFQPDTLVTPKPRSRKRTRAGCPSWAERGCLHRLFSGSGGSVCDGCRNEDREHLLFRTSGRAPDTIEEHPRSRHKPRKYFACAPPPAYGRLGCPSSSSIHSALLSMMAPRWNDTIDPWGRQS